VSYFDLPVDQLRAYKPTVAEPADFDEFWTATIAEARAFGGTATVTPFDAGLSEVEVFDVSFPGFGGEAVKGWFMLPRGRSGALPTVVEYNGYGGGRGFPHERLAWVTAGYAYFFMDTRGQGSVWGSGGDTPDPHGSGPSVPGFTTRGIENPKDYYYRRVFTDAVRAIDAVRGFDRVDGDRVAVCGGSQGGGIAVAAAGLVPDLIGAMPEVPFLQNFQRAVGLNDSDPYGEIARYLAVHRGSEAQAFETLSYFDGSNFAKRATAPAIFSVGLMDPICPPSTVYSTVNHWAANAEVVEYPYNEHEGGQGWHWRRQADWLAGILAAR
jgi:cephalosporin-C deacetylase